MSRVAPRNPQMGFEPPDLSQFHWRVAAALLALYATELAARFAGAPMDLFEWRAFGEGFAPWQPVTRFLVQGRGVLGVVLSLWIFAMVWPSVEAVVGRRGAIESIAAAAAASTAVGLFADAIGLGGGVTFGYNSLLSALFVLFGLAHPQAVVLLMFVLPIQARWFVILAFLLPGLFWLANLGEDGLGYASAFGAALGAWLWWTRRGPGVPRTRIKRKVRSARTTLRVVPGGRDDDTFHRSPAR